MSEHLDRLRGALADRDTIERELGQGGMAKVLTQDLLSPCVIACAPTDRRGRTVTWSDRPLTQILRGSIGVRSGMLYVPVAEQRLDVRVAEVTR
jgi:hypothetical protein